jgi:hypothetical protein
MVLAAIRLVSVASQPPPAPPPTAHGAAHLQDVCSIGSLFAQLGAISSNVFCRAGCHGTHCRPDWYPGRGDVCTAECGAVFEPFWDECGAMLVATGMGGVSEMSSFYYSCLHALYPPGRCGTVCDDHTYACYLSEIHTSCCDEDGTNCVAGHDVPLSCPVGCALVFPEFLETCRAHIAAKPSLVGQLPHLEAFEQSCLAHSGVELVDYATNLIANGCTLDLDTDSSNGGHRRRVQRRTDGFLINFVGSNSSSCGWDQIDDMANRVDAICGGMQNTCSPQCAIATRQFTTSCAPTLTIVMPTNDGRISSIRAFEARCTDQANPTQFLRAIRAANCPLNMTSCGSPGTLANADFGADSGVIGYTYVTPTGWEGSSRGVVVVRSG